MRIFISWSGEHSRGVALALNGWLPLLLQHVKPWMSATEIEAGQRWEEQLVKGLGTSQFGILCCTRDNLAAPWLLFEAGALANALAADSVCPLLFGISPSDLSGPLARFQSKTLDREGVLEMAATINRRSERPIAEGHLRDLFDALWPMLQERVGELPDGAGELPPVRPASDMLEELLVTVRGLQHQVQGLSAMQKYERPDFVGTSHLSRLPLEHLRAFAGAKVRESSLRAVASRTGIGHESVRLFINGINQRPHERTLRVWARWCLDETAAGRYPHPQAGEECN